MIVEVLDDKSMRQYRVGYTGDSLALVNEYPHYFGMVPIAIYENNEEQIGDFEQVITLIDAYDKMQSDSLNDFEYFCDAYLALYGFTADDNDVAEMKRNRVLLMDEGTSAEWLVKNENDAVTENQKIRLDADIHKFAKCPNMADKEFASNASGIAIKFKLLGTENKISIKERKFKKGLQQRLELLAQIQGLLTASFDWRAIDINFTRNIPTNDADLAAMVKNLSDIVSEETLLAQLPFVDNVADELQRLDAEREKAKERNPFLSSALTYPTNEQHEEVSQ